MKRRKFALILAVGLAAGAIHSPAQNGPEKEPESVARAAVESTSIASMGYARADKALEIEFRSGAVYRYSGVPEAVHTALLTAKSKGRYFARHIRGRYDFVQMKVSVP